MRFGVAGSSVYDMIDFPQVSDGDTVRPHTVHPLLRRQFCPVPTRGNSSLSGNVPLLRFGAGELAFSRFSPVAGRLSVSEKLAMDLILNVFERN
jgi:hypothetical protein